MSTVAVSTIDELAISLFVPRTAHEKDVHQILLMALAVVNILTITVTFLIAPAF